MTPRKVWQALHIGLWLGRGLTGRARHLCSFADLCKLDKQAGCKPAALWAWEFESLGRHLTSDSGCYIL